MSDEDYNGEWHKDFKELEGVHETQYPEECEDKDEEGGQVFDDEENESPRLMVLKN